jgi:hypothetical protein
MPIVTMYPSYAFGDKAKMCLCETRFCCYNHTRVDRPGPDTWMRGNGTGSVRVVLSTAVVLAGSGQIRYRICEAPAPTYLGATQCEASGDPLSWPIYMNEPLVFFSYCCR